MTIQVNAACCSGYLCEGLGYSCGGSGYFGLHSGYSCNCSGFAKKQQR